MNMNTNQINTIETNFNIYPTENKLNISTGVNTFSNIINETIIATSDINENSTNEEVKEMLVECKCNEDKVEDIENKGNVENSEVLEDEGLGCCYDCENRLSGLCDGAQSSDNFDMFNVGEKHIYKPINHNNMTNSNVMNNMLVNYNLTNIDYMNAYASVVKKDKTAI